jgi:hypothetical protein
MKRPFVTLLTALTFIVLAVTGILGFVRAFNIHVVGLHALMGFVFIGLVGFHVTNNIKPLKKHLATRIIWLCLAIIAPLALVLWLQPGPVKAILGLSGNYGPALERFELSEDGMEFQYSPDPGYKLKLTVKTATGYDLTNPPATAIWLENQGGFHIKTLRPPDAGREALVPYWHFKRRGWANAKKEAEEKGAKQEEEEVDAVSEATPNGSFDPADYILPGGEETTPYKLLIEVNQPGDKHGKYEDQPSLVYAVEIDNRLPVTYQVLEIVGYPKREDDDDGKEAWSLYYVDDSFGSALDLIDSALLTIDRKAD